MNSSALLILLVFGNFMLETGAQSSYYKTDRRFGSSLGRHRFRLISRNDPTMTLRRGYTSYVSPLRRVHQQEHHSEEASVIGPASALRAGREGSYTYRNPENTILKEKPTHDKHSKKPKEQGEELSDLELVNRQVETITESYTAVLHCYFSKDNGGEEFKNSVIYWSKEVPNNMRRNTEILGAGEQLRLDDGRLRMISSHKTPYSILVIEDVRMEDAGDYRCSLPTTNGTKNVHISLEVKELIHIDVKVPDVADYLLAPGEELQLYCRPNVDNLKVWWTAKNSEGETVKIDGELKVKGKKLRLENLSKTMSAIYTCHVENPSGPFVTRDFTVTVKEKPSAITAFTDGYNIDMFLAKYRDEPAYGDTVKLRCDSTGIPLPSVTWYRNDVKLSDSDQYNIKDFEPSYRKNAVISTLYIKNISASTEGSYRCVATNDMGENSRTFQVKAKQQGTTTPDYDYDDEDLDGGYDGGSGDYYRV